MFTKFIFLLCTNKLFCLAPKQLNTYRNTLAQQNFCPVLFCYKFNVSGFVGLLTDLFMCEKLSHKRIVSAFSPGHDSPSNDRFLPHADLSAWKHYFRNTATLGILPCTPAVSDSRAANNMAVFVPCPGFTPDSLVQRTRMRVREVSGCLTVRVLSASPVWIAHLPQKP